MEDDGWLMVATLASAGVFLGGLLGYANSRDDFPFWLVGGGVLFCYPWAWTMNRIAKWRRERQKK